MIDITVIRCGGADPGEDILDPLLTTIPVALERGRKELNEYSTYEPVTMSTVYRSGLLTGSIIEVHDSLQGASWRGELVGVSYRAEGVKTLVVMDIEKVQPPYCE